MSSSITDALHELQALAQWVDYIFFERESSTGKKITKPPINAHIDPRRPLKERLADTTNPATWATYEEALRCYKATPEYKGVGFVFSEHDPYCGIDLDTCRNRETGAITPWAQRIIRLLNSYTELSPTETGVHIIVRASLLALIERLGRAEIQHKKASIEIYDAGRYFTITGKHLPGTPTTIEERGAELLTLYVETFPEAITPTTHKDGHGEREAATKATVEPGENTALQDISDDELLQLARHAKYTGGRFVRLFDAGQADEFRTATGSIDESRADQALMGMLAYWTGKDAARMERLFQRSALYRRDRWNEPARSGETYGQGTIRQAIVGQRSVYDPTWTRRRTPRRASRTQTTQAIPEHAEGDRPPGEEEEHDSHRATVQKRPFLHVSPATGAQRRTGRRGGAA